VQLMYSTLRHIHTLLNASPHFASFLVTTLRHCFERTICMARVMYLGQKHISVASVMEDMNKDAGADVTASTSAVEETDADAHPTDPTATCGCDCACYAASIERLPSEFYSVQCECISCGPRDELGNRRCSVMLSPVIMLATALERGIDPNTTPQPCYCGDCREFCVLEIRKAAVKRARAKRERDSFSDVMPQPDADNEPPLKKPTRECRRTGKQHVK
jgi:hypothetical protein